MPEYDSTIQYRDVVGFPGYKVGSDGSVWSCLKAAGRGQKHRLGGQWKQLKPQASNTSGHLKIVMYGTRRFVHHLILEAFVGPRPPGTECRHFPDRNPANNSVANLQWDTHRQNMNDRRAHGTLTRGEDNSPSLTEEVVRKIRAEYAPGRHAYTSLAHKYGVSRMTIRRIVLRKNWRHVL